jgi:uncharacterized protein (TIGR03066 family)
MKTLRAVAILACASLFTFGCDSGSESQIVGKWEAGQAPAKITAEFAKDGKAKLTMLGQPVEGTYKLNGSDELEWTMNGQTTKFKVKVTATELQLTSQGNTVTYKKV